MCLTNVWEVMKVTVDLQCIRRWAFNEVWWILFGRCAFVDRYVVGITDDKDLVCCQAIGHPMFQNCMHTWEKEACGKMDQYTLGYCKSFVDPFFAIKPL